MTDARLRRRGDIEAKVIDLQENLRRFGCGTLSLTERSHLRDLLRVMADQIDPDAPPRASPDGSIIPWGSQDE